MGFPGSAGINLILFVLCALVPLSSQNDFFDDAIKAIQIHLENDEIEEIIDRYQNVDQSQVFKELTCHQQGTLIHKIGVAYYLLDREHEAIDQFLKVINDLWPSCDGVTKIEKANTIYNIGICYQYTGEKYKAKSFIQQALVLLSEDGATDPSELAAKYHGAGSYFAEIHDFSLAFNYLQTALGLYQQKGENAAQEFDLLNQLLILNLDFQNYDRVFAYYRQALVFQKDHPSQVAPIELASIYLNTGVAYIETSKFEDAREMAKKSLNLINPSIEPDLFGNALELLGMSYKKEGDFDRAKKYFEEVRTFRFSPEAGYRPSTLSKSIACENLGELHRSMGDFSAAIKALDQAISLLTPTLPRDQRGDPIINYRFLDHLPDLIRQLMIKIRLHVDHAHTVDASSIKIRNINLLQKVDTLIGLSIIDLMTDRSQLELINLIASNYEEMINICLDAFDHSQEEKYLQLAWRFSVRSKAMVLQHHLEESILLNDLLDPAQINEGLRLRQNIGVMVEALQFASSPSIADSLRKATIQAQLEFGLFQDSLEHQYPILSRARRKYLTIPVLDELQKEVHQDQAVVEFFVASNKIISFWITNDLFSKKEIKINDSTYNLLQQLIDAQQDPSKSYPDTLSRNMYDLLMAGGLEQLPSSVLRLAVIPSGILHGLSFDALHNDGGYLTQEYAISYLLSSSFLGQKNKSDRNKRFLGYGTGYGPKLNDALKKNGIIDTNVYLPSFNLAEQEVQTAAEIFRGTANTGIKATLDHFLRHASTADLLHLSLHGLVDYDNPHKSCIIFDHGQDKFILSPQILHQQSLACNLVVLSACHTADGKIYRGEGVSGMTRAFRYAGANSVVSSLWSATEQASLKTIKWFWHGIKDGLSQDVALQMAKNSYLKAAPPSQRHPYYWANYILVGQTQPLFQTGNVPFIPVLFFLIIVLAFYYYKK